MKEDKLTNALIRHYKKSENQESVSQVQTCPEVHYNHYGTRGIVDLFVRKNYESGSIRDNVIEIKSELTNANEIIRQFNKMSSFFYKGSDWSKPPRHNFVLGILLTKNNVEHLIENIQMYRSLNSSSNVFIGFSTKEYPSPYNIFPTPKYDISDTETYVERLLDSKRDKEKALGRKLKEILEELEA